MKTLLTENQQIIFDSAVKELGPEAEVYILNHEIGYTELAMYVRIAGKTAILAVVNPESRYAYIFVEDGAWFHGAGFRKSATVVGVC